MCFWYIFFFWNGVSWITRYNRNNFFISSFMKNICLSSNRQSSPRFWGWYSLLTFCGCCMTFFVCFNLLLGFLIKYFFIVGDYVYVAVKGFSNSGGDDSAGNSSQKNLVNLMLINKQHHNIYLICRKNTIEYISNVKRT